MAFNLDGSLSVVIPAFNEAQRIAPTLKKIDTYLSEQHYDAEIIVVDDGSTDNTSQIVNESRSSLQIPLRLIRQEKNRGKGEAIKKGILESKGDYVLFSDADLSTPIEELEKLLRAMNENNAQIVIGSRALKGSQILKSQAAPRQLSGKCFNLIVRSIAGLPFHDTQCGFKLFTKECAYKLFSALRTCGFAFDVEILYNAQRQGYKIVETPVVWINSEGSRVRFFRDSLKMLLSIIKIIGLQK